MNDGIVAKVGDGSEITIPREVYDGSLAVVASVSGGKDSTALMLALREAGVAFVAVFADTGWEAPETYDYLDTLREHIGQIHVCHPARDMVASVRHRAGFPGRMQRWCTQELKLAPLRAYHEELAEQSGRETVNAVGIRAEESASRARMPAWVDDDEWGGWVWRPLLSWSVADVLGIHRRHGVPLNPLYLRGHDRVGCYPCIFSNKDEIRLLSESRIAEVESLEKECTELRAERNAEKPGRYSHPRATFFQARTRGGEPMGIREVVQWAKTERGGRQMPIWEPAPRGGCMRWGMCETGEVQR